MNRIFLIGYMGTGKTTIGKLLATNMEMQFVDLDLFIENRYQKTIGKIFEEKGERAFREIEKQLLIEVSVFENSIISTGGGTPCFYDNMDYMNKQGITVYLNASSLTLSNRLNKNKDKRPLLRNKSKSELLKFVEDALHTRNEYYNKAQIIIDTDLFTLPLDLEKIIVYIKNELNKN